MRIISRKTLRDFWEQPRFTDSEQPLKAWFDEVKKADWKTPNDVKWQYRNASFIGKNRIIFNIHGNKYRLIVMVNYKFSIVYIRFVGTHEQYDKINAAEV